MIMCIFQRLIFRPRGRWLQDIDDGRGSTGAREGTHRAWGTSTKMQSGDLKNLLSKPLALWILNCDCVSLDILLKEVVLNSVFIFLTLDAEFLASFCHHNSQFHSLPSVIINILPSTFSIAIARHWDGELENIQNTFKQNPKWWWQRFVCYMVKILPATKAWKLKAVI